MHMSQQQRDRGDGKEAKVDNGSDAARSNKAAAAPRIALASEEDIIGEMCRAVNPDEASAAEALLNRISLLWSGDHLQKLTTATSSASTNSKQRQRTSTLKLPFPNEVIKRADDGWMQSAGLSATEMLDTDVQSGLGRLRGLFLGQTLARFHSFVQQAADQETDRFALPSVEPGNVRMHKNLSAFHLVTGVVQMPKSTTAYAGDRQVAGIALPCAGDGNAVALTANRIVPVSTKDLSKSTTLAECKQNLAQLAQFRLSHLHRAEQCITLETDSPLPWAKHREDKEDIDTYITGRLSKLLPAIETGLSVLNTTITVCLRALETTIKWEKMLELQDARNRFQLAASAPARENEPIDLHPPAGEVKRIEDDISAVTRFDDERIRVLVSALNSLLSMEQVMRSRTLSRTLASLRSHDRLATLGYIFGDEHKNTVGLGLLSHGSVQGGNSSTPLYLSAVGRMKQRTFTPSQSSGQMSCMAQSVSMQHNALDSVADGSFQHPMTRQLHRDWSSQFFVYEMYLFMDGDKKRNISSALRVHHRTEEADQWEDGGEPASVTESVVSRIIEYAHSTHLPQERLRLLHEALDYIGAIVADINLEFGGKYDTWGRRVGKIGVLARSLLQLCRFGQEPETLTEINVDAVLSATRVLVQFGNEKDRPDKFTYKLEPDVDGSEAAFDPDLVDTTEVECCTALHFISSSGVLSATFWKSIGNDLRGLGENEMRERVNGIAQKIASATEFRTKMRAILSDSEVAARLDLFTASYGSVQAYFDDTPTLRDALHATIAGQAEFKAADDDSADAMEYALAHLQAGVREVAFMVSAFTARTYTVRSNVHSTESDITTDEGQQLSIKYEMGKQNGPHGCAFIPLLDWREFKFCKQQRSKADSLRSFQDAASNLTSSSQPMNLAPSLHVPFEATNASLLIEPVSLKSRSAAADNKDQKSVNSWLPSASQSRDQEVIFDTDRYANSTNECYEVIAGQRQQTQQKQQRQQQQPKDMSDDDDVVGSGIAGPNSTAQDSDEQMVDPTQTIEYGQQENEEEQEAETTTAAGDAQTRDADSPVVSEGSSDSIGSTPPLAQRSRRTPTPTPTPPSQFSPPPEEKDIDMRTVSTLGATRKRERDTPSPEPARNMRARVQESKRSNDEPVPMQDIVPAAPAAATTSSSSSSSSLSDAKRSDAPRSQHVLYVVPDVRHTMSGGFDPFDVFDPVKTASAKLPLVRAYKPSNEDLWGGGREPVEMSVIPGDQFDVTWDGQLLASDGYLGSGIREEDCIGLRYMGKQAIAKDQPIAAMGGIVKPRFRTQMAYSYLNGLSVDCIPLTNNFVLDIHAVRQHLARDIIRRVENRAARLRTLELKLLWEDKNSDFTSGISKQMEADMKSSSDGQWNRLQTGLGLAVPIIEYHNKREEPDGLSRAIASKAPIDSNETMPNCKLVVCSSNRSGIIRRNQGDPKNFNLPRLMLVATKVIRPGELLFASAYGLSPETGRQRLQIVRDVMAPKKCMIQVEGGGNGYNPGDNWSLPMSWGSQLHVGYSLAMHASLEALVRSPSGYGLMSDYQWREGNPLYPETNLPLPRLERMDAGDEKNSSSSSSAVSSFAGFPMLSMWMPDDALVSCIPVTMTGAESEKYQSKFPVASDNCAIIRYITKTGLPATAFVITKRVGLRKYLLPRLISLNSTTDPDSESAVRSFIRAARENRLELDWKEVVEKPLRDAVFASAIAANEKELLAKLKREAEKARVQAAEAAAKKKATADKRRETRERNKAAS